MEYVDVATARQQRGLRLAVSAGAPAPWSQAAKGLLQLKGIPYTAVAQHGGQANEELVAWTGHRNAPVAVYEDERPRAHWYEILCLAERLAPDPPLLPPELDARVRMVGLANEICGEFGFAWTARLLMFDSAYQAQGEAVWNNPMFREYRYSPEAAAEAPVRVRAILGALTAQLRDQEKAGSRYFVGDALTALDVYWACFSQLIEPLPHEVNPIPRGLRAMWGSVRPHVDSAVDPLLLAHRDRVFEHDLGLPLDF